ncbi:unnamed protein product, partial [Prorocentrum cordatum]
PWPKRPPGSPKRLPRGSVAILAQVQAQSCHEGTHRYPVSTQHRGSGRLQGIMTTIDEYQMERPMELFKGLMTIMEEKIDVLEKKVIQLTFEVDNLKKEKVDKFSLQHVEHFREATDKYGLTTSLAAKCAHFEIMEGKLTKLFTDFEAKLVANAAEQLKLLNDSGLAFALQKTSFENDFEKAIHDRTIEALARFSAQTNLETTVNEQANAFMRRVQGELETTLNERMRRPFIIENVKTQRSLFTHVDPDCDRNGGKNGFGAVKQKKWKNNPDQQWRLIPARRVQFAW